MKKQTKKLKDITTKLKHTREMLHVRKDKYSQLVENTDCNILRMGKDGKITFLNEFAQKLFGYIEQQILGKKVTETIIPEKDTTFGISVNGRALLVSRFYDKGESRHGK